MIDNHIRYPVSNMNQWPRWLAEREAEWEADDTISGISGDGRYVEPSHHKWLHIVSGITIAIGSLGLLWALLVYGGIE